jgi:hypothetical protein
MILKKAAAVLCCAALFACGKPETPQLNDFQKQLLAAEGLPTEPEQLTPYQLTCIQHINEMMEHLQNKYGEEFIYAGYHEPEQYVSEQMLAYSKATGRGDGKYVITVKRKEDGTITDDYAGFSVSRVIEDLVTEHIRSNIPQCGHIGYQPGAVFIEKTQIENADFMWKAGGSFVLSFKAEHYSKDAVEAAAKPLAKMLYAHRISAMIRIDLYTELPADEKAYSEQQIGTLRDSPAYLGYYCFGFHQHPDRVYTSSLIMPAECGDPNGQRERNEYPAEDYLAGT